MPIQTRIWADSGHSLSGCSLAAPIALNPAGFWVKSKIKRMQIVLEAYRQHVAERAAEGIPPKPLSPEWTA
ncbi:MAG: hypothetical protein V7718_01760, partial [Porticoccus sp.]